MQIKEISLKLKERFGKECKELFTDPEMNVEELLTDSRNHYNPEQALFFAIKTPKGNDGHRFLNELFEKGVRNFVVEYVPDEFDGQKSSNIIIVPDSIEALTEVGKINRENAKEVLAITGSRGKTALKELIFQMMEPCCNISRSPRSYNSKIGVPLSLWQIAKETDLAVIEAGISKVGEMSRLAASIDPDLVVITNIGDAHSQGFTNLEEKAKEKVKLAYGERVRKVIYPNDDEWISKALSDLPPEKERITWSFTDPDATLNLRYNEGKLEWTWRQKKKGRADLTIQPSREYEIENIAAVLSLMLEMELPEELIESRLKKYHPIGTRLNVSEGSNNCSVILDSYTSDISSLLPAIDFMKRRKMPGQSLTLIISDLHHEGKESKETYKEMAHIVEETGIKRFIGIGGNITANSSFFPAGSLFYPSTDDFLREMHKIPFNEEIILLKGGPGYQLKKIHERLEAKKHETVLEVNLDAIINNYNYFRSKIPLTTGIVAMVKAFGYGAGSYEIAKTLQDAGASYLAVAAIDEGIDLRKKGVTMPVMVMNPRTVNYRNLFNHDLEPVVYSQAMLERLINEIDEDDPGIFPVHIKLDTGMHRMGFEEKDIEKLEETLKRNNKIRVSTIFSHLATADCIDMDEFTYLQLDRFAKWTDRIIKSLGYEIRRHILNSAGILRFPQYHYDLVRLGIGLYGANTLPAEIEKPLSVVSTLRSVIICIREISEDEAVGYGRKGSVKKRSRIATMPIGYADGMNRHFGNGAIKVMINGQLAPTIGNICMDATMIDVTDIDCEEGDSVEIFGENINVQSLADTLDTIPYEIFTSVSPRVKRIYYRE